MRKKSGIKLSIAASAGLSLCAIFSISLISDPVSLVNAEQTHNWVHYSGRSADNETGLRGIKDYWVCCVHHDHVFSDPGASFTEGGTADPSSWPSSDDRFFDFEYIDLTSISEAVAYVETDNSLNIVGNELGVNLNGYKAVDASLKPVSDFTPGEGKSNILLYKGKDYNGFKVNALAVNRAITSVSDMAFVRNGEEIESPLTGYFALANDIDYCGADNMIDSSFSSQTKAAWGATGGFGGVFDGRGHTIKNIVQAYSDTSNLGLFGKLNGGTVKNTMFSNIILNSKVHGSLIADSIHPGSLIENIKMTGVRFNSVADRTWTGSPLCGYVASSPTIRDVSITMADDPSSTGGYLQYGLCYYVSSFKNISNVNYFNVGYMPEWTDSNGDSFPLAAYVSKTSINKAKGIQVHKERSSSNSVHEVTVDFSRGTSFTGGSNGYNGYQLIIPSFDGLYWTARTYIFEMLEMARGTAFSYGTWKSGVDNQKKIFVQCQEAFDVAGLTMPSNLSSGGYYIKTAGNSVYIMGYDDYGVQNGVRAFIRYLGVEALSAYAINFKDSLSVMPYFDVVEVPDFLHRSYPGNVATKPSVNSYDLLEYTYQLRGNHTTFGFFDDNWNSVHTSFSVLPPSTYSSSHPKWYMGTEYIDEYGLSGDLEKYRQTQLCFTAHGNASEYQAMVEAAADRMVSIVDAEYCGKTGEYYVFGGMDNTWACGCSSCLAYREAHGGSNAAAVATFLNDVDNKIKEVHGRDIPMVLLAYHAYLDVPTGVTLNPNIGAYVANSRHNHIMSINDAENAKNKSIINGWGALTNTLFGWFYDSYFHGKVMKVNGKYIEYGGYMYLYDTVFSSADLLKEFKNNNAVGAFFEQQDANHGGYISKGTAVAKSTFSYLKEFMQARLMNNINQKSYELFNQFFDHYFGVASSAMKKLYFLESDHMKNVYLNNASDAKNNLKYEEYDQINKDTSWYPQATVDEWKQCIKDAYDAIEVYQSSNPTLYESLRLRVKIESISVNYIDLENHANLLTAETATPELSAFKEDIETTNVKNLTQGVAFSSLPWWNNA